VSGENQLSEYKEV